MARARFFKPGKELVDFLKELEFKHYLGVSNTKKYYYVNEKGNQIKLDYGSRTITLLNRSGNVVDYASTFTENEIRKFAEGDN